MTTAGMASPTDRWTRVAGRRLSARAWLGGDAGAPVVLVHGLVVASAMVAPTATQLAGARDVYAPDLPGFGRSDKPRRALDVDAHATALAGWLDQNGLACVDLVANSFGCQIATVVAVRRPELVRRLVLGGPTVDPDARTVPAQLRRWAAEQPTQSTRLRVVMLRDYARAGLGRALKTFRLALADRVEERLPAVEHPTLVVRGTHDPIVPQRWAEKAAALLPRGRLELLPGAPHNLAHDAPVPFSRVTRPF